LYNLMEETERHAEDNRRMTDTLNQEIKTVAANVEHLAEMSISSQSKMLLGSRHPEMSEEAAGEDGKSDSYGTSNLTLTSANKTAEREEVVSLFNNLADVISELAEQKDKIDVSKP